MKKVRTTISHSMKEILNEDKEHFKIELGTIGNILFKYYSNKEVDKIELKKSNGGEVIQFNLTKENEEMYLVVLKERKVEVDAEFLRDIIFTYINNPRYKREEILFEENFKNIKKAIEENKKINIKYHSEVRTVNPYFVKVADNENRSYLFCYCEKNEDYRCYRVAEIENILISMQEREIKDKEYIERIQKSFDPFRSYGKEVKAKFTKVGEKLLEKALSNKPKILEKKKNIYTFECDEKLAQVYFPQFFEEVEILEPESLREWMREKFKNSYELYLK